MSARAASKGGPATHAPGATERSPGDTDRETSLAMNRAAAEGHLTRDEQRFADLLALETQAVVAGAGPKTLRSIAEARRAAGLSCHRVGGDGDAAGLSPQARSRRSGRLRG